MTAVSHTLLYSVSEFTPAVKPEYPELRSLAVKCVKEGCRSHSSRNRKWEEQKSESIYGYKICMNK